MTIVVDASVVVSALVDGRPTGRWADDVLAQTPLAAPHLLYVEVANVLRRAVANGDINPDTASLAHRDLLDLRVELFGYPPFAARVWELRNNVTSYDGWYVAVAEALDAPLATLDHRLADASGPTCGFLLPT